MKKFFVCIMVAALAMSFGCKSQKTSASVPAEEKEKAMKQETQKMTEPTVVNVDATKKYIAVIKTSKGNVECELFAKDAPLSVTNFKQLADNGFYNGLTFHRVEEGFVIQGGDPAGTGAGGPGYTIPAEIGRPHLKGALAWARTGDSVNPARRSSGSQFYITLAPTPFLDGAYTVFVQTTKGMDVVEKIAKGDKIESIEVKVE
jgi:peptidyl-prolyl cis-trans isomerase B (cyclophilin B)